MMKKAATVGKIERAGFGLLAAIDVTAKSVSTGYILVEKPKPVNQYLAVSYTRIV